MSDAELLARWDKLMVAVEQPYARAILREKNRYIEVCAAAFPGQLRLTDHDFHEHASWMMQLAEHYQRIAIRVALAEVLKDQKGSLPPPETKEGWDALWLLLVRQWIAQHAAKVAKDTAETTRADLQRIIDAAHAPDVEFNPVQVAADMLEAKALSAFRAMMIARTETHNAMMFASQSGAEKVARDNDLEMKKRWVPVLDGRTRDGHAAMAGTPAIPMDQNFTVNGEQMARPGDPRGSASNVIHCRCVLAYIVS